MYPLQMNSSFPHSKQLITDTSTTQSADQFASNNTLGGPSPLMKQLTEKVRDQAERLQSLESYKALCESRLLDFDPEHPLPLQPGHLGTAPIAIEGGIMDAVIYEIVSGMLNNEQGSADQKRQLALKDQDLQYAKRKIERMEREL